jgi:hypothetical protein
MNPPEPDFNLDALFARARARRPDTSAVEYAFETRLLARLRAERETSSVWARVSWRLAPFFAVVVVALALWQVDLVAEANDTAIFVSFDNPEAVSLGAGTTN